VKSSPQIAGIAGYMGAGKSAAAAFFSDRGYAVIDADRTAKELMNGDPQMRREIAAAFGRIVVKDDRIDFRTLGRTAFHSLGALTRLNGIVHPKLVRHLDGMMKAHDGAGLALDAALLPLWPLNNRFAPLVWIDAPFEIRLERLKKRTALAETELVRRMHIQQELVAVPTSERWTIVHNDTTVDNLRRQLSQLITQAV